METAQAGLKVSPLDEILPEDHTAKRRKPWQPKPRARGGIGDAGQNVKFFGVQRPDPSGVSRSLDQAPRLAVACRVSCACISHSRLARLAHLLQPTIHALLVGLHHAAKLPVPMREEPAAHGWRHAAQNEELDPHDHRGQHHEPQPARQTPRRIGRSIIRRLTLYSISLEQIRPMR